MNTNLQSELDYRFERKFLTQDLSKEKLEWIVKNHSLCFNEIFQQRIVNNIYFDSPGFENLYDNVDGQSYREKYRIRWYGEMFGEIKKPTLEVKIKNGNVGKKKSFLLNPFLFDTNFNRDIILQSMVDCIEDNEVKMKLRNMSPILLNSYKRKYYLSHDKKVRVTIDFELKFSKINYFKNYFLQFIENKDTSILEVKYASIDEYKLRNQLDFSPLLLTKSSKYVQGFYSVY
jgi:SPX domain protein involved in polyphosphate accumulation